MSQLIVDFPHVLQAEEYQSVLNLLSDFKPTIQHSLHMKHFIGIVNVMLNKEKQLKASGNQIVDSFCKEHWHKIMELSFRQAATDKTHQENVDLLRVMIDNGMYVSTEFIKKIIHEIAEMSTIKKSNSSISLLISILRNVNTDLVDNIKNLKIAIIKWLRPQITLVDIMSAIEISDAIDKQLVSELFVLCVLTRQDGAFKRNSNSNLRPNEDAKDEHDLFIADAVRQLQYRMLSKLIVCDEKRNRDTSEIKLIEKLPERNEVKASMDDALFAELEKAIHDIDDQPGRSDNSQEHFANISATLATNVNILNALVGYESIDSDTFCKFLTKRVFLKVGQLNASVENFGTSVNIQRNPNDVNDVVDSLLSVWHDDYHPIIAVNLFIVKNSASIIKWLKAQLRSSRHEDSVILSPLKTAQELEFEERIQLKCLTLLAHFSAYEDENDEDAEDVFGAIKEHKFKHKRNQDLFILFQLIKVNEHILNDPIFFFKSIFKCV